MNTKLVLPAVLAALFILVVKDPAGHFITFAQFAPAPQK